MRKEAWEVTSELSLLDLNHELVFYQTFLATVMLQENKVDEVRLRHTKQLEIRDCG